MLFREVINLISTIDGDNEVGDPIKIKVKSGDICADKLSVRQSEFYQAAVVGLRPEIVFVIRTIEYNQETLLEYGGKEYTIIRPYEKDSDFTELVCQGIVNGVI